MTEAYYNENDDYAADWLENLIARGAIAPGVVDRRSIEDVRVDELRGFRQHHFFAGIGVWSFALRRVGVPDDAPVWTGSCPCQPFSAAGHGKGMDDERHLWPHWFHLISEFRPGRVFGEQVASKDGLGWLDLVSADMEAADYAFWAVDTCSAGSGAPHIRQRLRFAAHDLRSPTGRVQHAASDGRVERWSEPGGRRAVGGRDIDGVANDKSIGGGGGSGLCDFGSGRFGIAEYCDDRSTSWLVDLLGEGLEGHGRDVGRGDEPGWECAPTHGSVAEAGELGWMAHDDDQQQRQGGKPGDPLVEGIRSEPRGRGDDYRVADTFDRHLSQPIGRSQGRDGAATTDAAASPGRPGPTAGFWGDADWIFCRDGKWRPVEPGTFPLVDGSSFRLGSGGAYEGKSRQGMLKGYGNAIDAEATVVFLTAYLERDLIDIEHDPIPGDADGPDRLNDFSELLG